MAEEEKKEAYMYTMYTCLCNALPSLIFFFNSSMRQKKRYNPESCYGNESGSKSSFQLKSFDPSEQKFTQSAAAKFLDC